MEIYVNSKTGYPTIKATRAPVGEKRACRHVWITEEDLFAGRAEEAKARATEAVAIAERKKADDKKKAAAHKTHDFRPDSKMCMEKNWLNVQVEEVWDIKNPPRYFGLKVNGSGYGSGRKDLWQKKFPTHESYTAAVDEFCKIMALALGSFDALAKHESATVGQNPHTQMLISYPFNEDGTEKTFRFATGSRYAKFNDIKVNEMNLTFRGLAEVVWGTVSKQKFNAADPVCTWVAMTEEEIRPLETLQDHVERFIDYSRKDGAKYKVAGIGKKAKVHQYEFPVAWYGTNKRFSWWKTYGFTNLRGKETDPIRLEARTPSAIAYLLKWARKHSGVEVNVIDVPERDQWGIPTGRMTKKVVGLFVPGAKQGGSIRNAVTDEEFTDLRHALSYYNTDKRTDAEVAQDRTLNDVEEEEIIATISVGPETVEEEMMVDPFAHEEEVYAEPFRVSARYIKALRAQAPAWWERPGAAEYLAAMLAEDMDVF
jgi:hypothetical protein